MVKQKDLLRRVSGETSNGRITLYSTNKSPLVDLLPKCGIPSPLKV
jgi:hypothetical protein